KEESLQVSKKNHFFCKVLSVFNYGSFSQITIQMSKPTHHCSNSLSESQPGYEEVLKMCIMGIAAKVTKYPEGYCKLQRHFPEQNIGKGCYSFSSPLFDEVKKQQNALGAPGLEFEIISII
ncbi:hypothetical protein VP01_2305g2, partial [Puccinia sorghi]